MPNMTDEDVKILEKHVRNVTYIDRPTADAEMKEHLKNYPTCYEQRIENLKVIGTAAKFFDPLLMSKTNKIVMIDSDTIFFKQPVEIEEWSASKDVYSLHLKDKVNWFCIPYPEINNIEGLPKVKPMFNAGLLAFDKRTFTDDMGRVERILKCIGDNNGDFSGLDQTMYALMLPNQKQLPEYTYSCHVHQKVSESPDLVFKHYIGRNVRFGTYQYRDEGMAVIKDLME
jgi:lipopolysaccharide biosynthesis glycosyltransferase